MKIITLRVCKNNVIEFLEHKDESARCIPTFNYYQLR